MLGVSVVSAFRPWGEVIGHLRILVWRVSYRFGGCFGGREGGTRKNLNEPSSRFVLRQSVGAAARSFRLYPDFTVQSWAGIHWSDDPTFNEQYTRIVEGLRKAGLPEGEKKTD
jgi:hypothetical protein